LRYDKYSGDLTDFRFGLDWYPLKHVGFGASVNLFFLDVDVDEENSALKFDYRFEGIYLYATFLGGRTPG
jgi:hypothetical protein